MSGLHALHSSTPAYPLPPPPSRPKRRRKKPCRPLRISRLPPKTVANIFQRVAVPTLRNCRLSSRELRDCATGELFREITLDAGPGDSPFRFVKLALTPELACHVRSVTCDLDPGPDPAAAWRAVNALPYLQNFRNLEELHIRFGPGVFGCGGARRHNHHHQHHHQHHHHHHHAPRRITPDFQYRVLDTAFRCLTGTWDLSDQDRIDKELGFGAYVHVDWSLWPWTPTGEPLRVRAISIDNVLNPGDRRLAYSHAFMELVRSDSLTSVRVTKTREPGLYPGHLVDSSHDYEEPELCPCYTSKRTHTWGHQLGVQQQQHLLEEMDPPGGAWCDDYPDPAARRQQRVF